MRVLFLSASGAVGGAERSLLDVIASLRQAEPGWRLQLLAAADGPLVEEAGSLGADTTVLPFPPALARLGEAGAAPSRTGTLRLVLQLARAAGPSCAYLRRLRRAIAGSAPDVVHSNSLKMHVLAARAVPADRPLVWHLHDYVGSRRVTARLLRWNASRPVAAIANSLSVAADAAAVFGTTLPVVPVLNAVDLQRFSARGDCLDLDALAGLPAAPAGVVRIGLVATFGRWKGHETFLEAIAQLPRDLPIRSYLIGGALYDTDGSQLSLARLRQRAQELGLDDRVGFTGFVPRIERALRALDIVVHASTAPEPFGLVIAEAMACGRAVIASDAGGARELFSPGVDALGHPPGRADALAARIADLVRDADARARLGRAGRATAERRFDRTRLAAEIVPVYRRAAAFS